MIHLLRLTRRPLFYEYRRTLADPPPRLRVWVFGPEPSAEEAALLRGRDVRRLLNLDWRDLPEVTARVLESDEGDEWTILLDDDAHLSYPYDSLERLTDLARRRPRAGAVGPISGIYRWWRYRADAWADVEGLMDYGPLATGGLQAYRRVALDLPRDCALLRRLFWRTDVALALALRSRGWEWWERNLPGFRHSFSKARVDGDPVKVREQVRGLAQDEAVLCGEFPSHAPRLRAIFAANRREKERWLCASSD